MAGLGMSSTIAEAERANSSDNARCRRVGRPLPFRSTVFDYPATARDPIGSGEWVPHAASDEPSHETAPRIEGGLAINSRDYGRP